MRFWLEKRCSELTDKLLLDEHRSMHAYWNGMIKNPDKWIKHSILGPMDPYVMFNRHQEEVNEMKKRGWKHHTPMHEIVRSGIDVWRVMRDYHIGEWNCNGKITLNEESRKLQREYMDTDWWE